MPVRDLEELLGGSTEPAFSSSPDPAVVAALAPKCRRTVEAFLQEIDIPQKQISMLPDPWRGATPRSRHIGRRKSSTRALAKIENMPLAILAGPSDFFRSAKLVRSRVEISPQTEAADLVSSVRIKEADEDRGVRDEGAPDDAEDWE